MYGKFSELKPALVLIMHKRRPLSYVCSYILIDSQFFPTPSYKATQLLHVFYLVYFLGSKVLFVKCMAFSVPGLFHVLF
jgi:hypothetical protein